MHLPFWNTNKDKVLPIANMFKTSPTNLVNTIFDHMRPEEIEQRMLDIIKEESSKRKINRITLGD